MDSAPSSRTWNRFRHTPLAGRASMALRVGRELRACPVRIQPGADRAFFPRDDGRRGDPRHFSCGAAVSALAQASHKMADIRTCGGLGIDVDGEVLCPAPFPCRSLHHYIKYE